MKSNDQTITGASRKIQKIFDDLLAPKSNKKITHEQFIEALAISAINTSNKIGDGLGVAILQTLVFDLQDFINIEIYGKNQDAVERNAEIRKTTSIEDNSLAQDSILSRMGYSVAEGVHTDLQRQAILQKIYTTPHLPKISDDEAKHWGAPHSEQRLQAIAKFLSWLHSFQGAENPNARQKWTSDLLWLKEKFYNERMKFSWPEVGFAKKITSPSENPNPAFMKPLQPSKELAEIVGVNPLPRTEIISELWIYIKKNNLQDKNNPRLIICDDKLLSIFKKSQVSMFELARMVGQHLR